NGPSSLLPQCSTRATIRRKSAARCSSEPAVPEPEIRVFDSSGELFQAAAERLAEQAQSSVALSGGSTPRALFDLLTQPQWQARIDWNTLGVYWGDERCVPPDDEQSNFKL